METESIAAGKFLDPDVIIAQLKISRNAIVADFGCGPGYFSLPFAKAVGELGKVYALDILPQALESVKSKIKNSGIINIVTQRVNLEKAGGSKLEEGTMDWVILKDMLFQNQNKEVIIAEAYRVLKTGGKVLVVEWNQKEVAVGPNKEIRIEPELLEKMFFQQNFNVEKSIEAGDFHYAFVAVKN